MDFASSRAVRLSVLTALLTLWLGVYLVMLFAPPVAEPVPASVPRPGGHPPLSAPPVLDILA